MTRALWVSIATLWLPWTIRRWLLNVLCGYSIHARARIGLSVIGCAALRMDAAARIGHFNILKGARMELGERASIGDFNWISGLPLRRPRHFGDEVARDPAFILGRHAALTSRHYVDCSGSVQIGEFTTIAGTRSQILTHAIDIEASRQVSAPVRIGRYCFVGTGCVVLKGAQLPDFAVLAASSCLTRGFAEEFTLYGGVPAERIKELRRDARYFHRQQGFVD